jgi:DNA-directed RNA polymerase subunit RPC12/RpoP
MSAASSVVRRINLAVYRCLRCSHEWLPRVTSRPVQCPHCHSPYWDKQRRSEINPA